MPLAMLPFPVAGVLFAAALVAAMFVPVAIVRLPAALPLPPTVNAFVIPWAIAGTAAVFDDRPQQQGPRRSGSGVVAHPLVAAD